MQNFLDMRPQTRLELNHSYLCEDDIGVIENMNGTSSAMVREVRAKISSILRSSDDFWLDFQIEMLVNTELDAILENLYNHEWLRQVTERAYAYQEKKLSKQIRQNAPRVKRLGKRCLVRNREECGSLSNPDSGLFGKLSVCESIRTRQNRSVKDVISSSDTGAPVPLNTMGNVKPSPKIRRFLQKSKSLLPGLNFKGNDTLKKGSKPELRPYKSDSRLVESDEIDLDAVRIWAKIAMLEQASFEDLSF